MPSITTELRYIRIEDWNGNIYYPEGPGSGTGGSTVDGTSITETGITRSDGQLTSDPNASKGQAVIVTDDGSGQDKLVFTTIFQNLTFGKVSCDVRLKSSIGSGSNTIIVANCYYFDNTNQDDNYQGTLLSSTNISGDVIGVANQYVNIGFVTDYKGVSTSSVGLKVELLLKAGTGATIHFDYISTDKAFAAVTGTSTNYVS